MVAPRTPPPNHKTQNTMKNQKFDPKGKSLQQYPDAVRKAFELAEITLDDIEEEDESYFYYKDDHSECQRFSKTTGKETD